MTTDFNVLHARLERLEHDNATMQADNAQLQAQFQQAVRRYDFTQRRMRVQACLALAAVTTAVFLSPANRTAMAQGYGVTLATLNARLTTLENRVANLQLLQGPKGDKGDPGPQGPPGTFDGIARVTALEAKTQYMSVDTASKSLTFSGCNFILNNGLGATNGFPSDPTSIDPNQTRVNGLGNLIIGYNASRSPFRQQDIRTGSHNLILGDENNYSSFGGIVVGEFNTISNSYASVIGGQHNSANGLNSFISGGEGNIASGFFASISGGFGNEASGLNASVSGGRHNTASGEQSSVSGGRVNRASGVSASVSGGAGNTASAQEASVSGGVNNTASSQLASISGGNNVIQNNILGWSGGTFHTP